MVKDQSSRKEEPPTDNLNDIGSHKSELIQGRPNKRNLLNEHVEISSGLIGHSR